MINGKRLYAQATEKLKVLSGYTKSKRLYGLAALATIALATTLFVSGCGADYKSLYQDEKDKTEKYERLYQNALKDLKDNGTLQAEITAKDIENSGLKSIISTENLTISTLQTKDSNLEVKNGDLQRENSRYGSEIESLLRENSNIKADNNALQSQHASDSQQIQALERDGWIWGSNGWYRPSVLGPYGPTYPGPTYVTRPGESHPPGYNRYLGPGSYPGSQKWGWGNP